MSMQDRFTAVQGLLPTLQPPLREQVQRTLDDARLLQLVKELLDGTISVELDTDDDE